MLRTILRAKPSQDPPEDLGLTGEGVERKKIPALDTAYRNYKPHRQKFSEASRAHVVQKKKLIDKIHEYEKELPRDEAGDAFYITSDGLRLTLERKDKLSICEEEDEE